MQFLMNLAALIGLVVAIVSGVNRCSGDGPSEVVAATPAVTVNEEKKPPMELVDLTSDEPDIEVEEPEVVGYRCYSDVSPKLRSLIDEIRACDIENALGRHDSSVLSIIPAKGFKHGVADVFRKYRLHVNQNVSVNCQDQPWPDTGASGCKIGIYVSRIRSSNKYSDLAGWSAVWFRGVDDATFKPMSQFAEHISNANDSMLRVGGFMDVSDRP